MNALQTLRERLKALYIQNGVLDQNEQAHLLYERCPDASACWPSKTTACEWSVMQCPYIGQKYHLGKILFVGLNLRDYGGWTALSDLFDGENGVKSALRSNKRRINFGNPKYKGTLLFHRLALYANVILHPESDPFTVGTSTLADVCEYVAFLEAIKCSPDDGAMCSPIGDMRSKCPERYLLGEIEIIDPHTIVFFDKYTFDLLAAWNNAPVSQFGGGRVLNTKITQNGHARNIFRIIHPSSRGGAAASILLDLKSALQNCSITNTPVRSLEPAPIQPGQTPA